MLFWKRWWWAFSFCFLTLGACLQAIQKKQSVISEYDFLLGEMEKEKTQLLSEREELQLKLASQSDPAWIEMVLMRDLGVVPEGWLKVHFTPNSTQKTPLQ